jgi:hypothetical protein
MTAAADVSISVRVGHALTVDEFLPKFPGGRPPANDMTFEYLIAVLFSATKGCIGSWVVARQDDEGIDVGARLGMGSQLGEVTASFQAKLERDAVGNSRSACYPGGNPATGEAAEDPA